MSCSVYGLTLGVLVAGAAQAAAPVLPTGGRVAAGSAVIGAPGAGALTITQSSSRAILDWTGFSIGKGGKVVFDNGSGATLNRVTGTSVSSINGLLSATGSVYLINPNGLIIGRNGVVDVGGTFVASTLDTSDAGFLAGGPLSLSGSSNAAVLNYGRVGALGGDVALVAARVSNAGSLSAAQGSAGLIAGHDVVMLRDGALDQGRFSVLLGGAGTRVTNTGLIAAADAELRAEGGNVYALAGDTTGVIRAMGVQSGGGKVWLVAQGGELDLRGAVTAQGPGGAAGAIETSGGTVKLGDARIDAHGGTWLVDPYDLTIDSTAASTIDAALNAGTSVTEQTTASGYSGAGVANASGKGDITVAAPLAWKTTASLTLSAFHDIDLNADITTSGNGILNLYADNAAMGAGTINFGSNVIISNRTTYSTLNIFYYPLNNDPKTINPSSYTVANDFASHVQGGFLLNTYMQVDTVYDLQNIQNNLSASYALGGNINALPTHSWNGGAGFTPIGLGTNAFTGSLDGRGFSIANLTINDTADAAVGLFGTNSGQLSNIGILDAVVSSDAASSSVGSLVGLNSGEITNASATGAVSGNGDRSDIGGLAGYNKGEIETASAAVNVSALGSESAVGGLVGYNASFYTDPGGSTHYAIIDGSHASGSVSGASGSLGGLVGANDGNYGDAYITSSYATGAVTATSAVTGNNSAQVGGLVGYNYADEGVAYVDMSYATGAVTGHGAAADGQGLQIGGLVGSNSGGGEYSSALITASYASGAITAGDSAGVGFAGVQAGGLVGANIGYYGVAQVSTGYATGAVTVGAAKRGASIRAGGLIGYNDGDYGTADVFDSYATGAVRSGAGAQVGGLIAYNYPNDGTAYVEDSYFDTQTTLQSIDGAPATGGDASTGSIGLTTAQFMDATSPISGLGLGTYGANFVIIDSDGTFNGSNGATRPILLSEYSTTITNAHQLQLMALNLSTTYTLAANIDASGTSNPSDVWGSAGFDPVGQSSTPFTGALNGQQHTVTSLSIDLPSSNQVGLFGHIGGGALVENVTLASASIIGGTEVGALAGYNAGTVKGASGKGTVSGSSEVGGLVGYNGGTIGGSSGKAAVSGIAGASGGGSEIGGLVGFNAGPLVADHATGTVSGNSQVGGLIGFNTGPLNNNYATGAVSGASGKMAAGSGAGIGGLIGENNGSVLLSYATGTAKGYNNVGGLIGSNDTSGYVDGVYATGAASALSGNGTPSGSGTGIGGLVGSNIGQIADSYATGAVSGSSGKGALVGVNGGSISDSYATGKGGDGLVGINDGTLSQDYFDEGETGTTVAVGSGSSTGVTGIGGSTGIDPDQASSYAGFDFTDTWTIQPGASHPYLITNPQSPPPT